MFRAACLLALLAVVVVIAKKDERECEGVLVRPFKICALPVCKSVLQQVLDDMNEKDKTDTDKVSEKIREICGGLKNKENKFVGGCIRRRHSHVTVFLHWGIARVGHVDHERS
jgi:hypothetical protein